jgi:hypothetical protein
MQTKRPFTPLTPARRALVAICAGVLTLGSAVVLPAGAARADGPSTSGQSFHRLGPTSTAGSGAAAGTVTDSAVSHDGRTLVTIDGSGLTFSTLSDPAAPKRLARVSIDSPIAVAVAGDRVLVARADALVVISLSSHRKLGTITLDGTPSDVAASPDGRRAAVALNTGSLLLLSQLSGAPSGWHSRTSTIRLDARSGLLHRSDPQPDQLAYSPDGKKIAITLPDNDGISIVHATDGGRIRAISAGVANVTGIDTHADGAINLVDNLWSRKRRPTGVAWIDNSRLASTSPGTRSWSVYDTSAGKLTWDSGTGLEYRAVENGLYADADSAHGGTSPDTVAVGELGGTAYAFIGAKHGNFTAAYSLAHPTDPVYRQLLPTQAAAPITVTAKAVVAAGDVFGLRPGAADFPSLQSSWADNKPLGWDGTVGLAADQFHAEQVYTLTGQNPTQILSVNTSTQPAKIDSAITLRRNNKPFGVRATGLYQRSDGKFVIAATGAHAADNRLLIADRNGNIGSSITLPADVTKGLTDTGGLSGVSGTTINGTEYLWVSFARPLQRDPDGVFRMGRYDTDNKTWTWYGYRPESDTGSVEVGSINVVDEHRLALVEQHGVEQRRVEQKGGAADSTSAQQVTTVTIPDGGSAKNDDLTRTVSAESTPDLIARFTKAADPLPTAVTGLVTAGNDHGFLLADSSRDTDAGSQPALVDLGATADAFPEHASALGTTLASWLLPLSGVILIGISSLVAAGILVGSKLRKRPRTLTT